MKTWKIIVITFLLGSFLTGGVVYFIVKPDHPKHPIAHQKDQFNLRGNNKYYAQKNNQNQRRPNQNFAPNRYQLPDDSDFDNGSRDKMRADMRNQMQQMRKQMRDQMRQFWQEEEEDLANSFKGFFSGPSIRDAILGGSKGLQFHNSYKEFLQKNETKKSIIYEIDLKTVDENSLKINIKDGQLHVEGTNHVEEKNENQDSFSQSSMYSSFTQSFPIPNGVNASKAKIEKKEDKLLIILPKTNISI